MEDDGALFETITRGKGKKIIKRVFATTVLASIIWIWIYRTRQLLVLHGSWRLMSLVVGMFVSEICLGVYWVLTQSVRWNPTYRRTFKQRLFQRYENKLPGVDIFVCTADPVIEPPMMVISTVLSVMAYDYPPEKLAIYLSDDGGSELTFYALNQAAVFSKHWLPYCRNYKVEPLSPAAYFKSVSQPSNTKHNQDFISIQKLFVDMKTRIENVTKIGRVPEELRLEHEGFAEWDSFTSPRDHNAIVQIILDHNQDIEGKILPKLVYIAREKRPAYFHNFKAGAMNTLAVIKRLMSDVPFGVLLSGGLDSSLVASVTARHLAGTKAARQWGAQLHSFCVGLEGSPDLKAGREVADYLGTVHHEFHFTVQDGIDAIEDVIYHIESYDVTTIRASTPMFLMSRKIKSLGVKMVISGEGSDEIFGGYLYFHKAPNKEEFHRETCHKIKALHQYDCLRANKSTSAWGLEARVPFLDKDFINVAMSIDPEAKMINMDQKRIEKWILRRAFDDEDHPYLPKHILYRQKEQFSDGVGYSWIDGLKAHAELHVTDKMMLHATHIFPHNTPVSKEAYYYRMIFERFFPQNSAKLTVPGGASIACSTAKAIEWDASWSNNLDPSGRAALGVHNAAYKQNAAPGGAVNLAPTIIDDVPRMRDISAPGLVIQS